MSQISFPFDRKPGDMRANHGHLHKALIPALGKACLLNSRACLTVGMTAIPKSC
jgi:hypothetical protein